MTAEEYVVEELKKKTEANNNMRMEIARLQSELRQCFEKFSIIADLMIKHDVSDSKAYYDFTIWNDEKYFKMLEKLKEEYGGICDEG